MQIEVINKLYLVHKLMKRSESYEHTGKGFNILADLTCRIIIDKVI